MIVKAKIKSMHQGNIRPDPDIPLMATRTRMRIMSFAWTTKVLLEEKKTVTRRDWDDRYAKSFKQGDILSAYNKNPRAGGKKIAEIQLTKAPYKQWLHEVTDHDEIKEGALWGSAKAYQAAMGKDRELWVIEFELLKG